MSVRQKNKNNEISKGKFGNSSSRAIFPSVKLKRIKLKLRLEKNSKVAQIIIIEENDLSPQISFRTAIYLASILFHKKKEKRRFESKRKMTRNNVRAKERIQEEGTSRQVRFEIIQGSVKCHKYFLYKTLSFVYEE